MIKSRLRSRRNIITVDVKTKTLSGSQYTEANATGMIGLSATKSQRESFEQTSDGGVIVTIADVFYFEAITGQSLPAIEEKHVLVDGDSVRYEVVSVRNMAGEGNRLEVVTRRLR